MLYYAKPRIVVSACLDAKPTRYDGNAVFDQQVEKLRKYVEVISVCPEVGIGLGVPRNPLVLSIRNRETRLVDTTTGADYTDSMISFTVNYLSRLPEVDGFILKSASPSCGVGDSKVYDSHRRVVGKVDGLFTKIVKDGIQYVPIESEKRLLNYDIRRNFYTKIFMFAYVREYLEKTNDVDELVALHRSLKYLLMLYHPGILRELGRIVANRKKVDLDTLRKEYRVGVLKAFAKTPTNRSYASVLLHIYGHLKNHLSLDERRYVLRLIYGLSGNRGDVKTILTYFKGFVYRFSDRYLEEQRFLQPYPEELDESSNS